MTVSAGSRKLKLPLHHASPPPLERVFQSLADPTRLALVDRLSRAGPASVGELAAPFEMSLAAVLQHIRVLEASGIVTTKKIGRVRICRFAPGGLRRAERWIAQRRASRVHDFDRLDDFLPNERQERHDS